MSESLPSAPSAAVTAAAPVETNAFSQGASSFAPTSFESPAISDIPTSFSTIDFSGGSFFESDRASVFSGTIYQFSDSQSESISLPEIGPLPIPFETVQFHEGPEKPPAIPTPMRLSPILPKVGTFTEPLDKPYPLPFFTQTPTIQNEQMPDEMYEEIPAGELPSPEEAVSATLALLGLSDSSEEKSSDMPMIFEGIDKLLDKAYVQHQSKNPDAPIQSTVKPVMQTFAARNIPETGINSNHEQTVSVPVQTTHGEYASTVETSEDIGVSETIITEEELALSPEMEQSIAYIAANMLHVRETLQALNEINYPEPEMVIGKILTSQIKGVEVEIRTDPQQITEEDVTVDEQLSFVLRDRDAASMDVIIVEWVRDDDALQERNSALESASDRAYRHHKQVNGPTVLRYFSPTEKQKSEPLQGEPRADNSLTETVSEIRKIKTDQERGEMLLKVSRVTEQKPPVKLAVKGKAVTDEDVNRVFKWPFLDVSALIQQIASQLKK
ncbi:hypothetical protein HY469_04230 [Candidatus Roizmanbacteria bacterium]|nr:hypothetical protein [Candidatus Roizmanbacteria bacterium]